MAEKTLQFKAELDDKVTGKLKNIEGGLKGFAGKVGQHRKAIGVGMTAMGGAIVGALAFATKSAIDQEQGIRRLDASLKTLGTSYDEQKVKIEAAAAALQAKTNFGDEASREAISRLVGITGDLNLSLEALAGVADLAALKGMKLEKASMLVGRALAGEATVLASLGIDLDNTATATEVLTAIQAQYGGQAEASRDAVKALMARFEDLAQSIAQTLIPIAENLAGAMEDIILKVNNWVDDNEALVGVLVMVAGAVGGIFLVLGPLLLILPGIVLAIKGMATAFMFLNASMGPIGLIALAISAALLFLVSNTETLTAVLDIGKKTVAFVVKIYLAYIDTILMAVEATARFFGVKGVEKWAKDMRGKIDGVSKSMDNWAKSSKEAAEEVAKSNKKVQESTYVLAGDDYSQKQRMIKTQSDFANSIKESNAQIRDNQAFHLERSQEMEANSAQFVADIAKSNKEFEIQAAKEKYAAMREEGDAWRKKLREETAETKRLADERILSMMEETERMLAERRAREEAHDKTLDALRENLDATNIAWRESGSQMEDVIKRWAESTDKSVEEVLQHWDKNNIAVDNVKTVLEAFTEATGEDFLAWTKTVEKSTERVNASLDTVIVKSSGVGDAITDALGLTASEIEREALGVGQAEINWAKTQIDKIMAAQGASEGQREQITAAALSGKSNAVEKAAFGGALEQAAAAQEKREETAVAQAKASAEKAQRDSDRVEETKIAVRDAMRARIADIEGGYANGGITKGGIALVGERGPELVSLPSGSRVHPNGSTGGGMNFHFHGAVYGVEDLKRVVVEAVRDHAISGGFTGVFAEA